MRTRTSRSLPPAALCALLLLALAAAPLRAADDAAPPFADEFPESTFVYVSFDDIPGMRERARGTAIGEAWSRPEAKAFLQPLYERLTEYRRSVERELPPSIHYADLAACFSKRAAVGVLADIPNERMAVLIVGEAPDAEAPAAVVKALPEAARILVPSDGITTEATDEAEATARIGETTVRVRAEGPRLRIAIATDNESLHAILADGPSLADHDAFTKTVGRLGGARDVTLVLLQPMMLRAMAATTDPGQAGAPVPTTVAAALRASGLLGVTGVGVSTVAEGAGYRTRSFIHTPGGPEGLLDILSEEPASESLLEAIPETATAFAAKRIHSERIVPAIRAISEAMNVPEAMWNEQLASIEAQTGVHPLDGLVEPLGDEMALVLIDPLEAGGVPLFHWNGLALVARLDDAATFDASLRHFANMGGFLAQAVPLGGGPLAEEHEGVPITGLAVPSNAFAPCFAISDDLLVVGMSPQPVRMILDTIAGRSPSVLDRAGIEDAFATVGGRDHSALAWAASGMNRPDTAALSMQAAQMGILGGMLLPALSRARGASSQAYSIGNLKQIGLGLRMYSSEAHRGRMPETLAELYDDGGGILGEERIFLDAATGTGYHYVGGSAMRVPSAVVAFSGGFARGGATLRLVLFMDGHVETLPERAFQARLEQTLAGLREMGVEPEVRDPWLPPGVEPQTPMSGSWWARSPLNPYRGAANPGTAFLNDLLETLPPYRLPPIASLFPENAPATVTAYDRTADGFVGDTYGPLPFRCAVDEGFRTPMAGLQLGMSFFPILMRGGPGPF